MLLALLDFPRVAFDIDHDLSSSAAIEYFAATGVQFGADLVQNVGPLGWVHQSSVYAGYLHAEKLVLSFVTRAAFALLVLWAVTRFRGYAARVAWLAAILAPIPFGAPAVDFLELYHEGWAYLSVYLAALFVLSLAARRHSVAPAAPALLLLAFLALEKHTLLAVASFAVGASMLARLGRGRDRSAFALGLLFVAFVAGLWLLLGQRLGNLPAFAMGVARFTGGYNEAMALAATESATRTGALVVLLLAAAIVLRTLTRSQSLAKSLVDALLLFTLWKHGFVRGDDAHVVIFFHTAIALGLLFALARDGSHVVPAAPRIAWRGAAGGAIAAGVALLCAQGILGSFPGTSWSAARAPELWRRNLDWLRGPSWRTGELAAELRTNQSRYALPPITRIVGRSSIDFFGYQPGWVLLNHLNYVTRPMPIPFGASNRFLRERNEAFYRSPERSPEFVLVQLDATGPRPVTLDDGLALAALLDNYAPATGGRDLVLLERNAPEQFRPEADRPLLREGRVDVGDWLTLPESAERWLWLEADVVASAQGRLRSLALRPAPISIEIELEGREDPIVRRFAPSMGSSGFLVSPYIGNGEDLTRAWVRGGALLPRVRAVRFSVQPLDRRYFAKPVQIRLFGASAPRAPPMADTPLAADQSAGGGASGH